MPTNQMSDRPAGGSFDPYAWPPKGPAAGWGGPEPQGEPVTSPGAAVPPAGTPLGTPPPPPAAPWWQRDGMVSRLLAAAGVAVTLIGVVMLLVLAARAGLLGAPVRVMGGAGLSALLVASGRRAFVREGGRVGGIALAGTGIAGLFMVVVAVTAHYHWVPGPVGLVLAAVVAIAATVLAVRWHSQPLAVLVTASVAALAPVLTSGLSVTLIGFLVLLQAAGLVPEHLRGWQVLCVVRTLPAAVAVLATQVVFERIAFAHVVAAAVIVAVIGLGSTVSARGPRMAELPPVMYLVASTPVLAVLPQMHRPAGVLLAAVLAALTIVAVVVARPVAPATAGVAGLVTAILATEGAVTVTTGDWLPTILLVLGLGAGIAAYQSRSLVASSTAAALFAGGAGYLGRLASPEALALPQVAGDRLGLATAVAGLLVATGCGLYAVIFTRLLPGASSMMIVVLTGLCGLYGATAAILSVATAAGGFHLGHFVVTVCWMLVATALLTLGLKHPEHARVALSTGLALVAASLTKLFTFDLATLSGMTRAGTFLVVGLMLLAAGSRYAQAMARQAGTTAR